MILERPVATNSILRLQYPNKLGYYDNIVKGPYYLLFIAHDLCFEDRADLKILQQHLKLARSRNQFAKIKGNKLIVNEDIFTVNQLKSMNLDDLQEQSEETTNLIKSNSEPPTPKASVENQYFETDKTSECSDNSVFIRGSAILSPSASIQPIKKKKTSGSTSTNNTSPRAARKTRLNPQNS